MMKKWLLTILFLLPGAAVAGPWCLVLDATENCRFITAEECYRQSNFSGGYCKPNPRERGIVGQAPFCVITESERKCAYRSQNRCLMVAMEQNGGCVRNFELDLRRASRGADRVTDCAPGDSSCNDSLFGGSGSAGGGGSLDAAGYSSEQINPGTF